MLKAPMGGQGHLIGEKLMRADAAVAQFVKAVSLPFYVEFQRQDAAAGLEEGHELFTAQEVIADGQDAAAIVAFLRTKLM